MKQPGKILLKVCGMRDADNILAVSALSPDYMGFIFYPGSKRYVGDNFILPNGFPTAIKRVGVFVNADSNEIKRLAVLHKLNFIQLHGEETVDQCAELYKMGLKLVKVFPMSMGFDFNVLKPFEKYVDYFLFDTKSDSRGGSGLVFDWKILNDYKLDVPFFLGGGISLENIGQSAVLKNKKLYAVDINSKFEFEPGVKDVNLIRELQKIISV